jgi:hypothetical protein
MTAAQQATNRSLQYTGTCALLPTSHLRQSDLNDSALAHTYPAAPTCPGRRHASAQVRRHLVRDYHRRLAAGHTWAEGDVAWCERNTVLYPAICSLAGVVAGAFGVGGGVVKARGTFSRA